MATNLAREGKFAAAYAQLNREQRRAVDTIEGPVMVIAGPGTGKTQILTLRIANILRTTDTPPESILALTFTESGAKAMRERLRQFIGVTAYRVPIYTFHGLAGQLIAQYPDAYERIIGGRPASDLEKVQIIETILEDSVVKKLRPAGNPAYYVKPILAIISDLKKENITPLQFTAIINEQESQLATLEQYHGTGAHKGKVRGEYTKLSDTIIKNRELQYVYARYELLLAEQSLFDFEDMIVMTVNALEQNETMLRDLQEQYLYVLADEHQDVNGAQNRILELLASYHDSPNIFVVGDEKQAIYRFQGASLDNFLFFESRFAGTTVIPLTENYRSSQGILDLAHELVRVDDGPLATLRVPLTATTKDTAIIRYHQYSTVLAENAGVVERVTEELDRGIPAREIAVIVRTNAEVEHYATVLKQAGVAVKASAEKDVLSHPITHAVEALIATVCGEVLECGLFAVIQSGFSGIPLPDALRVLARRAYGESLYPYVLTGANLDKIGVSDVAPFIAVGKWIQEARERMVVESPLRVVAYVIEASGLRDHIVRHSPTEGAVLLRRLYEDIEQAVVQGSITELADVSRLFATRRQHNLSLTAVIESGGADAVHVMTAHKSKGLEFTVVCIPSLTDSRWGGAARRNNFTIPLAKLTEEGVFDAIDDERRLLYVALTRAKRRLYLSYATQNLDGREQLPSRLLEALPLSIELVVDTTPQALLEVFSDSASYKTPVQVVIAEALQQRGFSATSFNNFLTNPWHFVYRNVLRVPEVQTTTLQFGTVVHSVLEFLTRTHTQVGSAPSESDIIARLTTQLKKLPLSPQEYIRLHERGINILLPYIQHSVPTLPAKTQEEFTVRVLLETGLPELPEIPLSGNLDRLDFGTDGRVIRVVDYKTGKPKSRNEIEGNTKTSDGNYKRQLVFYALLLELHGDERYTSRTGTLSFVEPDTKGFIHEETFVITDDEIAALRQEIISATQSLLDGSALSLSSLEQSEYAHLARELVRAL
jgi:DNA helicase-2/ATP-dependent DNA helicase PcrA